MNLLDSLDTYQEYIVSPSGKKYTNEKSIPKVLAMTYIHLSETGYSGTGTKLNRISVTTLISPIKKYLYAIKYHDLNEIKDVSSIASSAKGTALHNAVEEAIKWWNKALEDRLRVATIDTTKAIILIDKEQMHKVIEISKIVTKKEAFELQLKDPERYLIIRESNYPEYKKELVQTETRLEKQFEGYIIDGEFDLFENNKIKDLKHVSNFSLSTLTDEMKAIGEEGLLDTDYDISKTMEKYPTYFKFVLQLSLYSWLRDNTMDDVEGAIVFSLNNGGGFKGLPVDTEMPLPLIPKDKLEVWIKERISLIKHYIEKDTVPDCTDTERILKKGSWKLTRYSQKTGKYRTVAGTTSDTKEGFNELIKGRVRPGDEVIITEPKYLACEWCSYQTVCTQYNKK